MKYRSLVSVVLVGLFTQFSLAASLKSEKAKLSYALGQQIGKQMKGQGIELDPKVFAESVSDVLKGKKSQLSEKDFMATMMDLQKKMQEKMAAKAKEDEKASAANKKKGEEFLKANRKKKGVKQTKSGLQYKVLKEGKGKNPKATSQVKVHYKGTLIDGTEFDSSYKRNAPATFGLNQVIRGWTEGLQLMKPGAKYQLYIPSDLAYGPRGRPSIPGSSTLIFDVELLEIVKE